MLKKYYFLFLGLLLCQSLCAQTPTNAKLDELDSLVQNAFYSGDFSNALPLAEKLVVAHSKAFGEKDSLYLNRLSYLAAINWQLGDYQKAEQLFLDIINICSEVLGKDSPDYANSINNLGLLYNEIGFQDKAEKQFLNALDIFRKNKLDKDPSYGHTLNNLATVYEELNRYEDAEPIYLQALAILKPFEEEQMFYATILNNLGGVYEGLKRFKDAESLYKESLQINQKLWGTKNHPNYAAILNNLSLLYSSMGKKEESIRALLESLEIHKKVFGATHPDYFLGVANLGELYFEYKDYIGAEKVLLQNKLQMEQNNRTNLVPYIKTLNTLSKAAAILGRKKESSEYLFLSIAANCRNPQLPHEINDTFIAIIDSAQFISSADIFVSLSNLFNITDALNDTLDPVKSLEKTCALSRLSLKLSEGHRNKQISENSKLRQLALTNTWAVTAVETHWKLYALKKDEPNLQKMLFSFAEQNKTLLLADALKAQKARQFGDLPDSLAQKEKKLQEGFDNTQKQLLETKEGPEKEALTAELNGISQQIASFKDYLEKKYPKYYNTKYASISADVADVQKLLDRGSLLLEYFVTPSKTYLFVIGRSEYEVIIIPITAEALQKEAAKLRRALSDYDLLKEDEATSYKLYSHSAHWIYKEFLAPALQKRKGIKRLILVPDNVLSHLPFEALLTSPAPAGHGDYGKLDYLLRHYSISYSYSATLLKENMDSRSEERRPLSVLAMAASYKNKNSGPEHLRQLRRSLQELPAAVEEVKTLSKYFAGNFRFDTLSNEAFFKKNAENYGVLHLSMHGLLNESYPILSGLVFTENGDNVEDNFLQAYEISHLKLGAQMVVLSACETGYGKFQQGEGVLSLARSFMYAGVPSLVVSMWQVHDASTAIIMKQFYINLSKGMNKAEALQKAKLEYINAAVGSTHTLTLQQHPAFWAPFIQLGDSRPLSIAGKGGALPTWPLLPAAGLILILGGLAWKRIKNKKKK